jgi:hypothetical protein
MWKETTVGAAVRIHALGSLKQKKVEMHAAKLMVISKLIFLLLQYGTLKRFADTTTEAPCVWCSGRAGL